LVTLDEFRKTRNDIEEAQRREAAQKQITDDEAGKAKRKKKEKKKERVALSFDIDEDEEETAFSKKRSNGDGSGKCQSDLPNFHPVYSFISSHLLTLQNHRPKKPD
jgi:hypothetical protein